MGTGIHVHNSTTTDFPDFLMISHLDHVMFFVVTDDTVTRSRKFRSYNFVHRKRKKTKQPGQWEHKQGGTSSIHNKKRTYPTYKPNYNPKTVQPVLHVTVNKD